MTVAFPLPNRFPLLNMDSVEDEVLAIFKESGALLRGHFVLRSGRHSEYFFQCAQVCQYLDRVTRLAELLLVRCRDEQPGFSTVLSPAMGGLVIGQELARQAGARFIFAEKVDDVLELRRGFKIQSKEPVLVVEDVVTRGGRVREVLNIIRKTGGEAVGVASLVDRSEGKAIFGVPFTPLIKMNFPTYDPGELPESLRSTPAYKPGS